MCISGIIGVVGFWIGIIFIPYLVGYLMDKIIMKLGNDSFTNSNYFMR
jgi:hypothetical protein